MRELPDDVAAAIKDGISDIDGFRRTVSESENGTDHEAAWELIDGLRDRLAAALESYGIEVPAVDAAAPPRPGLR